MSLDMSPFEASAAEPEPEPESDAPAAPRLEIPTADTTSSHDSNSHDSTSDDFTSDDSTSDDSRSDDTAATQLPTGFASPVAGSGAPSAAPTLPTRPQAEFDMPLAPPVGLAGSSQRPVAPDSARQFPSVSTPPPAAPTLPTRTNRGTGPEGPDRLADPAAGPAGDESPVATSEPSALQAALSAFDTGRNAVRAAPSGVLPTRARSADPAPHVEEPSAVAQSRIDPAALRDRLRAFQSEFSSAGDASSDIYTDDPADRAVPADQNTDPHIDQNPDHEGLPR